IALQGRQKAGKTETIRRAWNLLVNDHSARVVTKGRGTREIRGGILEVDGELVGFMRKSEPRSHLEEGLNDRIEAGCLVIVCATHMPGTVAARIVEALPLHEWRIKWIRKRRNAYDDERAEEIVAEVLRVVASATEFVEA